MLSLCEGWGLIVGSTAGLQLTVLCYKGFGFAFVAFDFFLLKWFSSLFYDDLEVYGLECTCGFGVPS